MPDFIWVGEIAEAFTQQAFEEMIASMSPQIQELLDEHEQSNASSLFDLVNSMVLAMYADGNSMKEMSEAVRFFTIGYAAGRRFGDKHDTG